MIEIDGELYVNKMLTEKLIEYAIEDAKQKCDKVYKEKISSLCNELKEDLDAYLDDALEEGQFLHAVLYTRDELDKLARDSIQVHDDKLKRVNALRDIMAKAKFRGDNNETNSSYKNDT